MARTNKKTKSAGNGEGSLYYSEKLKIWIYQYTYKGTRKTMKQHKGEQVKEFKARVIELKSKINNGTYVEKSSDTLYSILKHHINQKYNDGTLSPVSYKRNLETLSQMEICCKDYINKPIQKIIVEEIEESKKIMREKYSQSCINKMWCSLQKAFKLAYSRRKISFNIMEDETLTKPISQKEKKKVEALTIKEESYLMEILNNQEKNHKYSDIVKFQLSTGMRIGEALARSRNDVYLENNTILVYNTLTKDIHDKTILGKHTKTYDKKTGVDSGVRFVPLNSTSKSVLQEQLRNKLTNIYNLIFWDYENNTFLSNTEINSWLDRINKKYNISPKRISTHVLRHTRITRWKEAGVDMKVIQYWAGHVEGSNITNDTYISLQNEFIEKEYKKLEEV